MTVQFIAACLDDSQTIASPIPAPAFLVYPHTIVNVNLNLI